jgi:DNA-binding transcriptional LysR family regulator
MIDKLAFLVALAEEKHFGLAAKACGVSQPSLSVGIKCLEKALDAQLVERDQRFIGLTAEGERALEWARRIIADTRAMSQEVKGGKDGLVGRVRMAVIPTALPVIAELTQPLHARNPGLCFQIVSRSSAGIRRLLDETAIDAAISYVDRKSRDRLIAIPLYREEYRLVTNKSFSRPCSDRATWAEVSELPLCLMDAENRRVTQALTRRANAGPRITLESDSVAVLLSHIRAGHSAGVLPEGLLRSAETQDEFCILPIVKPAISCTIGLIMQSREPMTAVALAIAAQARQAAARLMPI